MKSKSIGSLILVLLASCSKSSDDGPSGPVLSARWMNQFRTPTSSHLRSVRFATSTSGVVAGDATSILRTNDGGVTWIQQEHLPFSRGGDIAALDAEQTTVHAAGRDAAGGKIWFSEGVIEWSTVDAPGSGSPYTSVDVVVPNTDLTLSVSYLLRANGTVDVVQATSIVDTRSSGTWTQANGIEFLGSTGIGFVGGEAAGATGQISTTSNFGVAWTQATPGSGLPSATGPLRDLSIHTSMIGYACGDGGAVLRTEDGQTWTSINSIAATDRFRGIHFPVYSEDTVVWQVDDISATGWVVGDAGVIYRIKRRAVDTDAGAPVVIGWVYDWTLQGAGVTTYDLYDVWFVDNTTGYAVGDFGTVLKTTNAGALWQEVSRPLPPSTALPQINAVDVSPNGSRAVAVGNGGVVLRTLDGGTTWEPFNTGVPAVDLHGVCLPRNGGGNTAYLCGANGTIRVQSNLGGASTTAWTAPTASAAGANTLRAVLFPDGDANGIAVGDGSPGTIVRTVDSGANWISTTDPLTPASSYRALARSADGTTVYAAGEGGIIISTADGGAVWSNTVPALGVSTQLRSIQAAPSGTMFSLFVAAADENVYRLTTGGAPAWEITTPLAGTNPVSIDFTSDLEGWSVNQGAAGGIFVTTNGGTTWTRSFDHTPWTLRHVRMANDTVGFIVGDNGTILKTTTGGQ